MATFHQFTTSKTTETVYLIVDEWETAFREWFVSWQGAREVRTIAIVSDENVWEIYGERIRANLALLDKRLAEVVLPPGEDSKDFSSLSDLIDTLVRHRIHRRDLLFCAGGGMCCDVGGLLALLYLRGVSYVNLPTSLMAQIDAAIGGKVGANFGRRKNLIGGFHHPVLTLMDSSFLTTLPHVHFTNALSEAIKVAMICPESPLLDMLEKRTVELRRNDPATVQELLKYCLEGKLNLLAPDPYEADLDRYLNLGHGVAHALERLPVMAGGRRPSHGEAVAVGLAAVIRYSLLAGLCTREYATRLLRILTDLGLPTSPVSVDLATFRHLLARIPEHRGGSFRLVVPVDAGGVRILPHADLALLTQCLETTPT